MTSTTATASSASLPPELAGRVWISWPRAATWTLGCIYGPLLVMCLYTQGWVSCSHCKAAVWQLAPVAPGLFLWHAARSVIDLPRISDGIELTVAGLLAIPLLTALAAGLRFAGLWRIPIAVLVLLGSSWLAYALFAVVRM